MSSTSQAGRRSASVHMAITLALATLGAPALAATLSHSTFQESTYATHIANLEGVDDSAPGTVSFSTRVEGIGSATGYGSTIGGALPRAEGAITVTSETNFLSISGGAYARINYYFALEQIGGTPVTDQIPIDIVTRGGIDSSASANAGSGDAYVSSIIYIDKHGVDVPVGVHSCIPAPCSTGPKTFDAAFTGFARPGEEIRVELIVSMGGWTSQPGATFSAEAWVDPRVEISPSYARREDFRLVFSEWVTPVPEPESYALMLAGLGLVGLVSQRSKHAEA